MVADAGIQRALGKVEGRVEEGFKALDKRLSEHFDASAAQLVAHSEQDVQMMGQLRQDFVHANQVMRGMIDDNSRAITKLQRREAVDDGKIDLKRRAIDIILKVSPYAFGAAGWLAAFMATPHH